MATKRDLEAFLDFLQERGVSVLQMQGGLANFDPSAATDVNTTAGDGSQLATAPAGTGDAQQVAKKAIVSAFLRHMNRTSRRPGESNAGGGSGDSSSLERCEQQRQQTGVHGEQYPAQEYQHEKDGRQHDIQCRAHNHQQPIIESLQRHMQQQQQHQQQKKQQQPFTNNQQTEDNSHVAQRKQQQQPLPDVNSTQQNAAASTHSAAPTLATLPAAAAHSFAAEMDLELGTNTRCTAGAVSTAPAALRHCEHKDCSRRPSFNFRGLNARFCSAHKETNMVDVAHKTRCQHAEGCRKHPGFGYSGAKPSHCAEHRMAGMVDLKRGRRLATSGSNGTESAAATTTTTSAAFSPPAPAVGDTVASHHFSGLMLGAGNGSGGILAGTGSGRGRSGGGVGVGASGSVLDDSVVHHNNGHRQGSHQQAEHNAATPLPPPPPPHDYDPSVYNQGLENHPVGAVAEDGLGVPLPAQHHHNINSQNQHQNQHMFSKAFDATHNDRMYDQYNNSSAAAATGIAGVVGVGVGHVSASAISDQPGDGSGCNAGHDGSSHGSFAGQLPAAEVAGGMVMSHGEIDLTGLGEGLADDGTMLLTERGTKRWLAKYCQESTCSKAPSYGPKGKLPLRCMGHKVDGDVYVKNQCLQMGCTKVSTFGLPRGRAAYCLAHKYSYMVDVKSKTCEHKSCRRRSSFGEAGKSARFCSSHRPMGMVDVVHRRCEYNHCEKHPTYGYPGQKRRFCSQHVLAGMVDLLKTKNRMLPGDVHMGGGIVHPGAHSGLGGGETVNFAPV